MATWQFDFHLIPESAMKERLQAVPVTIDRDEYDRVAWWKGCDLLTEIEHDLSSLLPRGRSWDRNTDTWGQEDGNRFDVLRDGTQVAEIYGRLDVRDVSLPFVNRVAEMARRHRLLIVTQDRHVLRPSLKELLSAIHRSRSFAFVKDPEAFLRRLGEND